MQSKWNSSARGGSMIDYIAIDYYAKIRVVYAEKDDITYIMRDEYVDGELIRIKCIAWYCGEPDYGNIKYYVKYPSLTANFKKGE